MKGLARFLAALVLCGLPLAAAGQDSTGLRALGSDYAARGWEAVGRIDTGRSYCTATLIAPDLVLTAAHCVYDMTTGAAIPAEALVFRAGYRAGRAVAERRVAQVAAHPGFVPQSGFEDGNIRHDVALLRLRQSISTNQINPFVLHQGPVLRGPVSIVSYGRGRSEVQSRERGCRLTDRAATLLVFDCDVTKGSSGAPVFTHQDGRGRIVSVISAEAALAGREVALGMEAAPLVEELKAMLRAGNTAAPVARINRVQVGAQGRADGAKSVRVPGTKSVRVPGG